jgi:hypothetical protein
MVVASSTLAPFLCEKRPILLDCRGQATLVASHSRHNLIEHVFRFKAGWTGTDPVAMLVLWASSEALIAHGPKPKDTA